MRLDVNLGGAVGLNGGGWQDIVIHIGDIGYPFQLQVQLKAGPAVSVPLTSDADRLFVQKHPT